MNVNHRCTNCSKYPFCKDIINASIENNCTNWKKMNYPQLKGICKIAIEKELCTGCNKLELENFEGIENCELIQKREKGI